MKRNDKKLSGLKSKRVLIFGGSGFLGKKTGEAFARRGAEVTALGHTDYDALDTSEKNQILLASLVKERDIIVNCIALINTHNALGSEQSRIVNTDFSRRLLESLAENNRRATVIFTSSQTVYGRTDTTPIDETVAANPQTAYGREKLEAEKLYEQFWREHAITSTVLRFSNIFGFGADAKQSVVSLFMERALSGQNIRVFGKGMELRDYIHVNDAAEAIVYGSSLQNGHSIFNVSSGNISSVREIARKIIDMVGHGRIEDVPFPESYARYEWDIVLNSERFKKATGWTAQIDLDHGLSMVLSPSLSA